MRAQQSQHTAHQYNKNRNIPAKKNTIFRHRCFMRNRTYDLLGAHMDPRSKYIYIK
jgi:hypothetical protein